MKKIICLMMGCFLVGCKTSKTNAPTEKNLVFAEIDTVNTVLKGDYLHIEADIYNKSGDTVLILKPKAFISEPIDFFSVKVGQSYADSCMFETIEVPYRKRIRYASDFITINPNAQTHVKIKGGAYNQLIYCEGPQQLTIAFSYKAQRLNGANSEHVKTNYLDTDKRALHAKTLNNLDRLYEGEIKSNQVSLTLQKKN